MSEWNRSSRLPMEREKHRVSRDREPVRERIGIAAGKGRRIDERRLFEGCAVALVAEDPSRAPHESSWFSEPSTAMRWVK